MQQPSDFITRADLRAELDASEKRLHDHLTDLASRLERADDHLIDLASRLERAENTLLNGFRNYTRTESVRTKALEGRVHELERRMLDVETHRSTPPDDQQEQLQTTAKTAPPSTL